LALLPATVLVLKSQGMLTERVVADPTTFFPFSQVFFAIGRSRFTHTELEFPLV